MIPPNIRNRPRITKIDADFKGKSPNEPIKKANLMDWVGFFVQIRDIVPEG